MYEIVVCGSLCNTDIAVAELLSRYGFHVRVLRYKTKFIQNSEVIAKKLKYFNMANIVYLEQQAQALAYLKTANLIISLTGGVDEFLRLRNLWFRNYTVLPKTINITTGADITELVRLKTSQAKKFNNALQRSAVNLLNPYPQVIESLKLMKLNNYQIVKSPYYLLDILSDASSAKKLLDNSKTINYLHASNLDWGVTDNKPWRNTTKGNNKFLQAFIRALNSGANISCKVLLRGPDKDLAKKMIVESGHAASFEFLQEVNQGELHKIILDSDIVVDQFDVGALGGIACEAMAQQKPVMTYIDKDCWPLVYSEEPPVINGYTEDDLYHAILEWTDRNKLHDLGERAERWVRKYHDVHCADFSELILRVCMTSGLTWPRVDLEKHN